MTAGIRIWKDTAGETETKQMIPDKLLQEENRVSGEEKRNPSGSPTDSTRKERCGTKRREGTERQEGTEQQDGTWKPESLRQHPAQGAGERSTDRDLQESQELARESGRYSSCIAGYSDPGESSCSPLCTRASEGPFWRHSAWESLSSPAAGIRCRRWREKEHSLWIPWM